jgi:predicted  nucleic acid-binding Zn-ribbon protein
MRFHLSSQRVETADGWHAAPVPATIRKVFPMSPGLTIEILRSIRDEVKQTNARLDQTNVRLDQTNARLDQTNTRLESMQEELSRRIVESETRTATAITDLAGTVREMTAVLRQQADLRPRVEKCESDIRELRRRVDEGC